MAINSINDFAEVSYLVQTKKSTPKIFVICLAAYNSGTLHGVWINATQEIHQIQQEIKKMLLESPIQNTQDFGIHASEGFGSLNINGYESIEAVHNMAVFIAEVGEIALELLDYYGEIGVAREVWEKHYQGGFANEMEFAIQLFEVLYMASIPEKAQCYIDYAAFKRDIFVDEYFSLKVKNVCHIFSCSPNHRQHKSLNNQPNEMSFHNLYRIDSKRIFINFCNKLWQNCKVM